MESILVLTHADESGTTLTRGSLEAVSAGKELAARLSASLTIGIVAADTNEAAPVVAGSHARLLGVSGEAFAQARYATDAAACEALCRAAQATIVLAPSSSRFARVAAGVSHRLGGVIDTHIAAITGEDSIHVARWFYRQRVEAVLSRRQRPWFLLLDGGTCAAYASTPAAVNVEQVSVEVTSGSKSFWPVRQSYSQACQGHVTVLPCKAPSASGPPWWGQVFPMA